MKKKSNSNNESQRLRPTDSYIKKYANYYYSNDFKMRFSPLESFSKLNQNGSKKKHRYHFDSKKFRLDNPSLPYDFGSYSLSFLHSREKLVQNGNLLSSSEVYQQLLFSTYLSVMDNLYPGFCHCCECLNFSRSKKRQRVEEDIGLIFDSVILESRSQCVSNLQVQKAWFVKCAFSPEYRSTHSDKKLKADLMAFANSHFGKAVGNFDIGVSETGQHLLHSHWVCSSLSFTDDKGKVNFSKLQEEYKSIFGYVCDFKEIFLKDIYNDKDTASLSRYLTKINDDILVLSAHAVKDSASFSNIMQTKELRDFKKELKQQAKEIFLNSKAEKEGGLNYDC